MASVVATPDGRAALDEAFAAIKKLTKRVEELEKSVDWLELEAGTVKETP